MIVTHLDKKKNNFAVFQSFIYLLYSLSSHYMNLQLHAPSPK